jgi:hypothetical protein
VYIYICIFLRVKYKIIYLNIIDFKPTKKLHVIFRQVRHYTAADLWQLLQQLRFVTPQKLTSANSGDSLVTDADRDAWEYMRKNGRDIEVEPPRRMMTRSQTRGPEAGYSASANDPT